MMKKIRPLACALLLVLAAALLSACAGSEEQTVSPPRQELTALQTPEEEREDPQAPQEDEPAEQTKTQEGPAEEVQEALDAKRPELTSAQQEEAEQTPAAQDDADPAEKWRTTLDNTAFLQSGETLAEVFGIDDTYAVAYTNTGENEWGLNGRALLIDRKSGSVKQELHNVAADEYQVPIGPLTPIRIEERILFGWQSIYTSGKKDHYYTIANGSVKKCESMVDATYLGDGVFQTIVRVSVNDIDMDKDPELFFQHLAWAYHTYWYFWSEDALDLREYRGIEITRDELAALETGDSAPQQYIRKMEQDGYVFDCMYLRGNGILNVNFYQEQEGYRDLACGTYLYSSGVFAPYPDAQSAEDGGRYEASCWKEALSEAVVFPPLAAIRSAQ